VEDTAILYQSPVYNTERPAYMRCADDAPAISIPDNKRSVLIMGKIPKL
jgi:hypothetical protein